MELTEAKDTMGRKATNYSIPDESREEDARLGERHVEIYQY